MSSTDDTIEALENADHRTHQRREHRLERLGWGMMAVVIAAAFAGVLGPGLWGRSQAVSGDGRLALEYDKCVHHEAPVRLVVKLRGDGSTRPARVRLSRSLRDHATLETIVPRPIEEQAGEADVAYAFRADSGGDVTLMFRLNYEDFGEFDHRVALDDGTSVLFRQYVLP